MLCILCGVSPSSRGRDFYCLGVVHNITSSWFPSCIFAMCIFVLSYCCRQYWYKCICIDVCILTNMFMVSLLHHNTSGTVLQLRLFTEIEVWCGLWVSCAVDLMPRCICRERLLIFSSFHEAFLIYLGSWLHLFQWWLGENIWHLLNHRNNLTPFPVLGFDSYYLFFVWLGTDPERNSRKCGSSACSDEI